MIPDIGLMIGAYIITRMVSFLTRNGDRAEHIVVKVLAAITGIITIFLMYHLIKVGSTPTSPLFPGRP